MTNKELKILIDKIIANFQLFLAPEHNRRIIFLGSFGIGNPYSLIESLDKENILFVVFLVK